MAAVMVLGLAACSSGASEPEEVSRTETTAEGESNTDAQGSTGLKIGLAVQTLSNQVWAQQAERIQQDAEADGNEVTVVDCKENANTQIDQLENFISSGVDAIIVNPVDAAAIEEVCKEAREAGILVMSWDEEMENSDINWLIDNYVRAEDSEKLVDLADISFLDLIDTQGDKAIDSLPKKIKQNERSVAENLAANMRKMIISERPNNPAYFDKMSDLLNHLLQEQKDGKIQYKELIKKLIEKLGDQINDEKGGNAHAQRGDGRTPHAARLIPYVSGAVDGKRPGRGFRNGDHVQKFFLPHPLFLCDKFFLNEGDHRVPAPEGEQPDL